MDDTLKHTFPLGSPPAAVSVTVSRPTEGQMFILAMSRETAEGAERMRLIKRLIRVLETLTGPDQWDSVIETAMISGSVTPLELVDFAQKVFVFDWAALEKSLPQPGPQLSDYEDVIADAMTDGV